MDIKKIKIAYLINGLGYGGAEMMLYRLLERIDRKAYYPVVIVLLDIPGPLAGKIKMLEIDVHIVGIKSKHDFWSMKRLYHLLKDLSVDILHTQLYAADIIGRILGRMIGISLVITSIRNVNYGGFWRYQIYRLTDKLTDRTTFVSDAAAKRFIDHNIVKKKKTKVIYNGLDPNNFYKDISSEEKISLRVKMDLPDSRFMILAVGSLTKQKGYFLLFQALELLSEEHDDWFLAVAGSGPLKNVLVEEVKRLGLSDKVFFLGRSDNIPGLMAAADVLALSSYWEGMPGVIMEAMASELPVIGTAVGGTPELVDDSINGYLVPAGDHKLLGEALIKVLKLSFDERMAMGKAGRRKVIEFFHVERMARDYENIYHEAMQGKTN